MNANEMTFGVEIETVAPDSAVRNDGLRIGGYHNGLQVPYLPLGWKAERDGSISTTSGGHACEIVSPILRGSEGLAQVAEVVRTLEAKGHRVNVSCGVHVHVGWRRDLPADALARLVTIVSYCERGALDRNRYHALNLTNLAHGTRDTVEFRVFSGSLNAAKVIGWIQVCLGLAERAINGKRTPKWNPTEPRGGWKKAGPGRSEAERLIGYLAWGAGYARIHGGRQYGWISDVVSQDQVKNEFRRLAAKYDAQA
jgi:hypothetical protein